MGTGPKPSKPTNAPARRVAVVGRGRLGGALALALSGAGIAVDGPLGRDDYAVAAGADAVLLCVPDSEIAPAAHAMRRCIDADSQTLVGHCSGATGLAELAPDVDFSMHPLMTVIGDPERDVQRLRGASAAIAAGDERSLAMARELAIATGMDPIEITEADRPVYHAAATLASNFLVALEGCAETLADHAGVSRERLIPLVRATVENWAAEGARRALTGPIARGDEATVARQRAAIARTEPELLELFDALTAATRALGREVEVEAAA